MAFRSLTYVKLKPGNVKKDCFLLAVTLLFSIFIYFEIKPHFVAQVVSVLKLSTYNFCQSPENMSYYIGWETEPLEK